MRHTHQTRLNVNRLEDRTTPASVTAILLKGTLALVGDGGCDVNVNEYEQGKFRVVGNNGTTVNGQAEFDSFATGQLVNNRLLAGFGSGNDVLTFNGATTNQTLLKEIIVTMGSGNDTLTLNNIKTTNVRVSQGAISAAYLLSGGKGSAIFANESKETGNDTVTLSGLNEIGENLKINTGGGTDTVNILAAVGQTATIQNYGGGDATNVASSRFGKDLIVWNTAGTTGNLTRVENGTAIGRDFTVGNVGNVRSQTWLLDSAVGRTMTVNNGSKVTMEPSETTTTVVERSQIGWYLAVNGGVGSESVSLADSHLRNVVIRGGEGDNGVSFNRCTTANVSVVGGGGSDRAYASGTVFAGDVKCQMGNGYNTVYFGDFYSENVRNIVQGHFDFTGGSSYDSFLTESTTFLGHTNLNLLAGNDYVSLQKGNFFADDFLANLSSGNDSIYVNNEDVNTRTRFLADFTVNLAPTHHSYDQFVMGQETNNLGEMNGLVYVYGTVGGDFRKALQVTIGPNAKKLGSDTF